MLSLRPVIFDILIAVLLSIGVVLPSCELNWLRSNEIANRIAQNRENRRRSPGLAAVIEIGINGIRFNGSNPSSGYENWLGQQVWKNISSSNLVKYNPQSPYCLDFKTSGNLRLLTLRLAESSQARDAAIWSYNEPNANEQQDEAATARFVYCAADKLVWDLLILKYGKSEPPKDSHLFDDVIDQSVTPTGTYKDYLSIPPSK
ncbi:MAG: hypothetical protein JSS83_05535 [Cyanobacteria bacterium SZAS LIN-3]|nr:hypothetical protein [Cyanobacteria bacterium SZAS LIN-3]